MSLISLVMFNLAERTANTWLVTPGGETTGVLIEGPAPPGGGADTCGDGGRLDLAGSAASAYVIVGTNCPCS